MKLPKAAVFILATYLLFGCEKSDYYPKQKDVNLVSTDYATEIAQNLNLDNEVNLKSTDKKKKISDVDVVFDEDTPLYYIINYKNDKGFVILSADKRCMPILAFSEKGQFKKEQAAGGLLDWMERSESYVKMMKADTSLLIPFNKKMWEEIDSRRAPDPELDPINPDTDDPVPSAPIVTELGPLISTAWGQGCGYNAQCPTASNGPCGRAVAGCPTIAIAQIMRYKQHPSSYNWGAMPNRSATAETARLIRDIGDAISVDWGGDGTGLTINEQKDNIPTALKNVFGYGSNVQYIDYFGNQDRVVQELRWGSPVYMRGGEKEYWVGLIPYYGGGHAWVCDGYRKYQYTTHSYLYLSMNWGWSGIANGWFAFNNFNPMLNGERQDFNYKVGCIVGIRP